MSIFYLVPLSDTPSWGLGIIYHHVQILQNAKHNAWILFEKKGKLPEWLDLKVPFQSLEDKTFSLVETDILVVPEVMVGLPVLKKIVCKKVLFLQATAFLFESLPSKETHQSLGFIHVMAIMPHMIPVVERHVGLPVSIIPPFIADYFFTRSENLSKRERKILLYPKFQQIDYSIVRRLILDKIKRSKPRGIKNFLAFNHWEMVEVKGYTHKQVSLLMQKSAFFISLNLFEAFNTSVPEAMAAGCINFCYEGIGPRDYLRNAGNAYVFGNNEAYALCEKLFEVMDQYDEIQDTLHKMRKEARLTALLYKREQIETRLEDFFNNLIKTN